MEVLIAVMTLVGIVFAILSNTTFVLRFIGERREKWKAERGARVAGTVQVAAMPLGEPPDAAPTSPPALTETPTAEPPAVSIDSVPPPAANDVGIAAQPEPVPARIGSVIRTPDQRLRVFVSSTLQELAAERRAARRAIEGLHLAPVLFELGARPHAPRDLYRAYLAQSQVFVGIYWQRYGWLAPGAAVSGLEDEYRLAAALPKLIYVKGPAVREPRLEALLARIRADDRASYQHFAEAAELEQLLANDLALLLSERFETAGQEGQAPETPQPPPGPPAPANPLIGREREQEAVAALLMQDGLRLLTLSGPGGIGKSRLAMALAAELAARFEGGAAFVPLAPISDPALVVPTIAKALGLHDSPGGSALGSLKEVLAGREMLLVLDNFEQVASEATAVSELLAAAPRLKVLVTSRAALHLSAEHEFPVPPLSLPEAAVPAGPEAIGRSEAVRLFVTRARAVRPEFALDAGNAEDVAELCRRLDGLPLAIELAAARSKLLSPRALLQRLDRRFELLTGGARDMPERQQTLRNTFDWSYALLDEGEQRLLAVLGLFVGGATLEAAQAVCAGDCGPGLLDALGSLVDKSLLRQQEPDGEPRFSMLETIRQYAAEKLAALPEAAEFRRRHAAFFLDLAERAEPELRSHQQARWVMRLERDIGNLRAAAGHALDTGEAGVVARMGWALWAFWWVRGYQNEGRVFLERALAQGDGLTGQERARALFALAVMALIQGDYDTAQTRGEASMRLAREVGDTATEGTVFLGLGLIALYRQDFAAAKAAFEESLAKFRARGDRWGIAHTLHYLWRLSAFGGKALEKGEELRESARLLREIGDLSALVLVLHNLALVAMMRGDTAEALEHLAEGLDISVALDNRWYLAYCIEGIACALATRGRAAESARLFGAAQALRAAVNAPQTPADAALYQGFVSLAQSAQGEAAYRASWDAGRALGFQQALQETRELAATLASPSPAGPGPAPREVQPRPFPN